MEGYVIQTEAGIVAITCVDPKAEKVLSLFGESLSLNRTEILSGINDHIFLNSEGTDSKANRFNSKTKCKKLFFELDPENIPRIFMRDGSPAKKKTVQSIFCLKKSGCGDNYPDFRH